LNPGKSCMHITTVAMSDLIKSNIYLVKCKKNITNRQFAGASHVFPN
jgi:hypothetical protein